MTEEKIRPGPKTKLSLENCVRMAFHPKGNRRFMEGMNEELELGPRQSVFNKYVGTFADVAKYIVYGFVAFEVVYNLFYK
jgi:hypothetical protein